MLQRLRKCLIAKDSRRLRPEEVRELESSILKTVAVQLWVPLESLRVIEPPAEMAEADLVVAFDERNVWIPVLVRTEPDIEDLREAVAALKKAVSAGRKCGVVLAYTEVPVPDPWTEEAQRLKEFLKLAERLRYFAVVEVKRRSFTTIVRGDCFPSFASEGLCLSPF